MNDTETKFLPVEILARKVLVSVRACKNTMDRYAYMYRVQKSEELMIAMDWCLEKGLLKIGTTNASARAWSRGASDELPYLTKTSRAWLDTKGAAIWSQEWAEFRAKCAAIHARAEERAVSV